MRQSDYHILQHDGKSIHHYHNNPFYHLLYHRRVRTFFF